jgi:hypothetical protein
MFRAAAATCIRLQTPFLSLRQSQTKAKSLLISRVQLSTSGVDPSATAGPIAPSHRDGLEQDALVYHGPLTSTVRRLKIFSLSSLALSATLTPFMFVVESSLPLSARFALATTAIVTSAGSTALVAWCGSPYVTTLRRLNVNGGIEMTTFTLGLKPLVTRVYDTAFLVESKRPFAKWELAERVPALANPGCHECEETVAESLDATGAVMGRWVVKWSEDGQGTCHQVGKVARYVGQCVSMIDIPLKPSRYFNVHDELLD